MTPNPVELGSQMADSHVLAAGALFAGGNNSTCCEDRSNEKNNVFVLHLGIYCKPPVAAWLSN